MNIIEQTLARVAVTEGFAGLHLVEVGTGHVLASIEPGDEPDGTTGAPAAPRAVPDPEVADDDHLVTAATDVVRRITSMVTVDGRPDDLEDLVITMTGHHHLIRVMPGFAGTDAFLVLTLDRARANLALARYLLLTFEAELVA